MDKKQNSMITLNEFERYLLFSFNYFLKCLILFHTVLVKMRILAEIKHSNE